MKKKTLQHFLKLKRIFSSARSSSDVNEHTNIPSKDSSAQRERTGLYLRSRASLWTDLLRKVNTPLATPHSVFVYWSPREHSFFATLEVRLHVKFL